MANSKYEYIRNFERNDALLPNVWLVVRVDGHAFHKFTELHHFAKPNDAGALRLMNRAAEAVMSRFNDIVLAYGSSDEFSFLLRPQYQLYDRRESKLLSTVVSLFTGAYIVHWPTYMPPTTALHHAPAFDGRVVAYPTTRNVRDYFSWRQVDAHINNLYNTAFWALVLKTPRNGETAAAAKLSPREAEARLRHTNSAEKHELLWQAYGINYNNEAEMFKKGSILVYDVSDTQQDPEDATTTTTTTTTTGKSRDRRRKKAGIVTVHVDLIQDTFWQKYPNILET